MANSKGETSGKALEWTGPNGASCRLAVYWEPGEYHAMPAGVAELTECLLANPEARMAVLEKMPEMRAWHLAAQLGTAAMKRMEGVTKLVAELESDTRLTDGRHAPCRASEATISRLARLMLDVESPAIPVASRCCFTSDEVESCGKAATIDGMCEPHARVVHGSEVARDQALSAPTAESGKDSDQQQGSAVETIARAPRLALSSEGEATPSSALAPTAGNVAKPHGDPARDRVTDPAAGRATELAPIAEAPAKCTCPYSEKDPEATCTDLCKCLACHPERSAVAEAPERVTPHEALMALEEGRPKDGNYRWVGILARYLAEQQTQQEQLEREVVELRKELANARALSEALGEEWRKAGVIDERDALRAKLSESERKLEAAERELGQVSRFHKLLLDRTGSTSVEPVDEIMGRWLTMLQQSDAHHIEHHNCEACHLCPIHHDRLPEPAAKEPTGGEPAKPPAPEAWKWCPDCEGAEKHGDPKRCTNVWHTPPAAEAEPSGPTGRNTWTPGTCAGCGGTNAALFDGAYCCRICRRNHAAATLSEPADPAPPRPGGYPARWSDCSDCNRAGGYCAKHPAPRPGGDRPVMMGELLRALRHGARRVPESSNSATALRAAADEMERTGQ